MTDTLETRTTSHGGTNGDDSASEVTEVMAPRSPFPEASSPSPESLLSRLTIGRLVTIVGVALITMALITLVSSSLIVT